MIISEINFFIECTKILREIYENINAGRLRPNTARQRQLETFLKTWIFYNSSSKKIYWTGRSSEGGLIERVKEHQYSNLSSVRYILNPEIGEDFFALDNKEQLLSIFRFMQWNYTSKKENSRLREFQNADIFYGEVINGDPENAYGMAEITLTIEDETADMLPRLNTFLEYNNKVNGYTFEIDLTNNRFVNFIQYLTEASNNFNIELEIVTFSNKGCIFRLINNQTNFTDLYRVTMYSLWRCFNNAIEINNFLNQYNYAFAENGPYRNLNNFNYPDRAFTIPINHQNQEVYLDTYNDIPYKYNLISKILDFFDATCVVYNFNLEKQFPTS